VMNQSIRQDRVQPRQDGAVEWSFQIAVPHSSAPSVAAASALRIKEVALCDIFARCRSRISSSLCHSQSRLSTSLGIGAVIEAHPEPPALIGWQKPPDAGEAVAE
jgi:hypothetical protein